MRLAGNSSMSNIAEGLDAWSDPEFDRFVKLARGSATEVRFRLCICIGQRAITGAGFEQVYGQAQQVKRLIGGCVR